MTAPSGLSGRAGARDSRLALPVYTLTIFLSAFLLFGVQPMFTKMVMPTLGGTPAVWSVAMVFFQTVLLAGYAYAHGLTRWLDARVAALVHLALMAVVLIAALPIAFGSGWGTPPEHGQALWLIGVFTVSVGLPFFAVSANGPLLQAWFARTGHPHADDPYFLYGASNIGSLLALLSYPLVVEQMLPLAEQSSMWSAGFGALLVSIAGSALFLRPDASRAAVRDAATGEDSAAPVTGKDRLGWIGLSMVPSALLVATTAHVTSEVAAVPLMWVAPLALYLVTFSVAFRDGGERLNAILMRAQPLLLAAIIATLPFLRGVPFYALLAMNLAFFTVSVTLCHRELYSRRPGVAHLTQFYFFMSLGGVIGGALASLAAPLMFEGLLEFPLLVLAVLLCRADVRGWLAKTNPLWVAAGIAAAAVPFLLADRGVINQETLPTQVIVMIFIVTLVLTAFSFARPAQLMAAATTGMLVALAVSTPSHMIERTRSFFAVHSIFETTNGQGRYLQHGNTLHGAERIADSSGAPLTRRPEPASYFHFGGAYHQAIEQTRQIHGGKLGKVAVIGLGMGSLACHAKTGETWDFFEIDPEVVRIARDKQMFRSFSECTPGARTIVGDGRLTLADEPGGYDLIMLDAFSYSSPPVHLLTREAVAMYASKLAPGGMLIFNISNRNMVLSHVVAASARDAGLTTWHRKDDPKTTGDFMKTLKAPVEVAVVARRPADVGSIARDPEWTKTRVPADFRTWTDDFSNILDPLRRKLGW
ncbi:MAG: spermidine synthase [Erythrobacter sp.]